MDELLSHTDVHVHPKQPLLHEYDQKDVAAIQEVECLRSRLAADFRRNF